MDRRSPARPWTGGAPEGGERRPAAEPDRWGRTAADAALDQAARPAHRPAAATTTAPEILLERLLLFRFLFLGRDGLLGPHPGLFFRLGLDLLFRLGLNFLFLLGLNFLFLLGLNFLFLLGLNFLFLLGLDLLFLLGLDFLFFLGLDFLFFLGLDFLFLLGLDFLFFLGLNFLFFLGLDLFFFLCLNFLFFLGLDLFFFLCLNFLFFLGLDLFFFLGLDFLFFLCLNFLFFLCLNFLFFLGLDFLFLPGLEVFVPSAFLCGCFGLSLERGDGGVVAALECLFAGGEAAGLGRLISLDHIVGDAVGLFFVGVVPLAGGGTGLEFQRRGAAGGGLEGRTGIGGRFAAGGGGPDRFRLFFFMGFAAVQEPLLPSLLNSR
jgi:hypothetical protein